MILILLELAHNFCDRIIIDQSILFDPIEHFYRLLFSLLSALHVRFLFEVLEN